MPLNNGIVSFWNLDEASGARADGPGANPLLEVNGPIGSTTGVEGDAATFVGASNQILEVASTSVLMGPPGSFSVAGWVRFTTAGFAMNQRLWGYWNTIGGGRFFICDYLQSLGVIRFLIMNATETGPTIIQSTGFTLAANTWYFVAARYESILQEMFLTINATNFGPVFVPSVFSGTPTTRFVAGGFSRVGTTIQDPGSTLDGNIDNLGYWNRALTNIEVSELYGGGTPPTWPFPDPRRPVRDKVLVLQRCFDPAINVIQAVAVSGLTQGGFDNIETIFGDVYDEANQRLRVVNAGAQSANRTRLDAEQILQQVHDPGAQALRVVTGTPTGVRRLRRDFTQILQEAYDPTNEALRVSPQGAGGTGGSRLDATQVLQEAYNVGVGLRMSI